jgi:hypothetical protein
MGSIIKSPWLFLVDELTEEDKAIVPLIDLTRELAADGVVASALAEVRTVTLANDRCSESDSPRLWPICQQVFNVLERNGPSPSRDHPGCHLDATSGLRVTRWGRCEMCERALRPGMSATACLVLVCSKLKRGEGHTYRVLTIRMAEDMHFPRTMIRRIRILW